jgi:hypothetical protein
MAPSHVHNRNTKADVIGFALPNEQTAAASAVIASFCPGRNPSTVIRTSARNAIRQEHKGMSPRQILRFGWVAGLALLYGTFVYWYGGAGTPLSQAETEVFTARLQTNPRMVQHPQSLEAIKALMAQDDGREFYMVNLEELKADPEARKEDLAYARAVIPALLSHGSFPVYVGQVRGLMLGDNPTQFSRAAVVRYRSLRDFLGIFTAPAMAAGVNHKFASMAYTEARPTSPIVSVVSVRLTLALAFTLLGLLGWMALRPRT